MERIPRTNRLVWKMESFCKICWNAKIKILSIKASTFHLISLDIQRIKFIDDTSSNARAIMTLNYRQVKVYISQQCGRFRNNCNHGCKLSWSVNICPLIGLKSNWWFEPSMVKTRAKETLKPFINLLRNEWYEIWLKFWAMIDVTNIESV